MKENAGINCRVFLTFVTMSMLVMTFVILPSCQEQKSQEQKSQEQKSQPQKTAKIYGKAAIIMNSGDVKPVAKKNFILLPFSLWNLNQKVVKESEAEIPRRKGETSDAHQKRIIEDHWKRMEAIVQKAKEQGKYAEFKTDFDGSYEVVVAPGDWYICTQLDPYFGVVFSIGNSHIAWAVPITVKEGQVLKLDLENGNASYIMALP